VAKGIMIGRSIQKIHTTLTAPIRKQLQLDMRAGGQMKSCRKKVTRYQDRMYKDLLHVTMKRSVYIVVSLSWKKKLFVFLYVQNVDTKRQYFDHCQFQIL
jgi:hypothetical protein